MNGLSLVTDKEQKKLKILARNKENTHEAASTCDMHMTTVIHINWDTGAIKAQLPTH